MSTKNNSKSESDNGYVSIKLWEQKENYSTYYDRELDLQGRVPGHTLQEAKEAFNREFGK